MEHGVKPPRFVLAAAQREKVARSQIQIAHADEQGRHDGAKTACCARHGDHSCDHTQHITLAPGASRGLNGRAIQDQTLGLRAALGVEASAARCVKGSDCKRCAASKSQTTTRAVAFVAAMRCRGLSISVCLLPPSLPVEIPRFNLAPPDHVDSIQLSRALYASPTFDVATPPPDAHCA
jgi:hypothetical protein